MPRSGRAAEGARRWKPSAKQCRSDRARIGVRWSSRSRPEECHDNSFRVSRPHQGWRHNGSVRPALVHGDRQCKRRQDGDRRHQCRRRLARSTARAVSRGQRNDGQCGRREGHQADPAGSGRRDLRWHLQLHATGDQGPCRRGRQEALHLPGAVRGPGVRSAHLLHRPRACSAGRAADSLADGEDRGEELLPAVSGLHLAPHAEPEGP